MALTRICVCHLLVTITSGTQYGTPLLPATGHSRAAVLIFFFLASSHKVVLLIYFR